MRDNGKYQLQTEAGERICEIVRASEALDRTKITAKLYGGQYLMQTIGTPTRVLNLTLRAWSVSEQQAVNGAEAACAVIAAKLDTQLYMGALLDAPDWNTVIDGRIFEASAKFLVIE